MPAPIVPPQVLQRRGIASQLVVVPETAWNTDPGSPLPFLAQLADKINYAVSHDLQEAPVYKGMAVPPQIVDMNYNAAGSAPMAFEYVTLGRFLKLFYGTGGYTHPDTAGNLHYFFSPNVVGALPISCQLIRKYNEATIQYFRSKGNFLNTIHYPFATAGRATYDVDFLGSGTEVYTTLGGAPTDDGWYTPASYFNMQMIVNGSQVVGLTNFDDTVSANLTRQDVGANGGIAGSINAGFYSSKGTLGTVYSIDNANAVEANNFLTNLAVNQTEFAVECIYFNTPLNTATRWFRRRRWVRIGYPKIMPGGPSGVTQEAPFMAVGSSNALWSAERIGDALGPIALTASFFNLGIKIDGGGTVTTALPTSTQTIDQIVTTLNAAGPFLAIAVADNFMGHLRITSKAVTLKGAASSVAIDTAVANSAHTLLGFTTNTVYNGFGTPTAPVPILDDLYNQFGAAY